MPPSKIAAQRGEPSYIWRDGQERRLNLLAKYTFLDAKCILIDGIGVGMYASQIQRRYTPYVEGFDIEFERVQSARDKIAHAIVAAAEAIPYPSGYFDTVFSHEVLEHVRDDRLAVQEMIRVLKPGGRAAIFTPNRWYPFETHGHYWRGEYRFGNTPLINYLPAPLRDRLAPHVRAYTKRGLLHLFNDQPTRLIHYERVYGAYDNIIARVGNPARRMRDFLQHLEGSLFDTWGLSHFLIMEKV